MHLAPALPRRRFELQKNGLQIALEQITDARGALYTFWAVTYGRNTIKSGLFERDHGIPAMLKHIADTTPTNTDAMHMVLRGLTWTALDNHEHVPASELRKGDHLNWSGRAVEVLSAQTQNDGTVLVGFAGLPFVRFSAAQLCNLTERGPQ